MLAGLRHARERAQALVRDDLQLALLDRDHALLLQARQGARDGFQLQAQVVADLLARHPQDELAGREAAPQEAPGQFQQEGTDTLLGPHRAQQHHQPLVPDDLARDDPVQTLLQRRKPAADRLQLGKGHDTDIGVFQRHGITVETVPADGIETQHITRHRETDDLLAPIGRQHPRLEEAGPDRIDGIEGIAGLVEIGPPPHATPGLDHAGELFDLDGAQALDQAQVVHAASDAGR